MLTLTPLSRTVLTVGASPSPTLLFLPARLRSRSICVVIASVLAFEPAGFSDARASVPEDGAEVEPPPGMVLVPEGTLSLGMTREELVALFDARGLREKLKHFESEIVEPGSRRLVVPGFFIDTTEVTNRQYEIFARETRHPVPDYWRGGRIPDGKHDHPVVEVSFEDAVAFAAWAGKRLPTEIEWERAARGDGGRPWPWGDHMDDAGRQRQRGETAAARLDLANTAELQVGDTLPVGSFPKGASPFGCMDLCGNAAEWTASWYEPYAGNKLAGSEWGRVARGGGFMQPSYASRATVRIAREPNQPGHGLGFRCAKSLKIGRDAVAVALERLREQTEGSRFDLRDAAGVERVDSSRDKGLVLSSRSIAILALAETRFPTPDALLRSGRVTPVLLAIAHLGAAVGEPEIPPGDYLVFFQTGDPRGFARWQKANAARNDSEPSPEVDGRANPEGKPATAGDRGGPLGARGERGTLPLGLASVSPQDRVTFVAPEGTIVAEILSPKLSTESETTSRVVADPERGLVEVTLAIPGIFSRSRLVVRVTLAQVRGGLRGWR